MVSKYVQYVHQHPPRCIGHLKPIAVRHSRPTLLLPKDSSVYHGEYDDANTASFVIGCPCGNCAVYLLGYYVRHNGETGFVGPLRLECPKCLACSEFFDTRKHGYDGEQGVDTYLVGQGEPARFACPHCGTVPLLLNPNFTYNGDRDLDEELQPPEDYFGGLDIVGQCTQCAALVEITSFECS